MSIFDTKRGRKLALLWLLSLLCTASDSGVGCSYSEPLLLHFPSFDLYTSRAASIMNSTHGYHIVRCFNNLLPNFLIPPFRSVDERTDESQHNDSQYMLSHLTTLRLCNKATDEHIIGQMRHLIDNLVTLALPALEFKARYKEVEPEDWEEMEVEFEANLTSFLRDSGSPSSCTLIIQFPCIAEIRLSKLLFSLPSHIRRIVRGINVQSDPQGPYLPSTSVYGDGGRPSTVYASSKFFCITANRSKYSNNRFASF